MWVSPELYFKIRDGALRHIRHVILVYKILIWLNIRTKLFNRPGLFFLDVIAGFRQNRNHIYFLFSCENVWYYYKMIDLFAFCKASIILYQGTRRGTWNIWLIWNNIFTWSSLSSLGKSQTFSSPSAYSSCRQKSNVKNHFQAKWLLTLPPKKVMIITF